MGTEPARGAAQSSTFAGVLRRRGTASIVANPVLVGAVTTLVVVVAVFLAYNANQGLPFVPTTQLKFRVSNGSNLLPGNEIREGGARIGVVDTMEPIRLPDGTVGAEATIKIDKVAGDIPKDTTLNLRPRSVLGLKYVELNRGRSKDTLEDGQVIPADQVSYPVDLDDYYRIFDEPTRTAVQQNLRGFGNALSNRGASLNETIRTLPRFLGHLAPVAEVLADDRTQLARFLKEAGDVTRVLAPVADRYAHSFAAGADTFEAWSRHPDRLRATIRNNAPTMRVGIRSFRVQRPFLADTARFSRALRGAAAVMPGTLPGITDALQTGTPVQRRLPEMHDDLRLTLGALRDLAADERTIYALRGVTRLVDIVNPLVRFAGPYITVCNYWNYAWTNVSEHLTEPDPTGGSQRTLLNQAPRTRNPTAPSVGTIGARQPSNGEEVVSGSPMNLHSNLYTAAIDKNGNADCESGQRGYLEKLTHYNTDKNLKIVTDPRIPGNQGPTYTGRPRVPEGQTFTRTPETGPAFPRELDKP
jgi:virulence factor Mce-like protein